MAPRVAVEDGKISIDCGPQYLRSFLSAGNPGDRLMIAALARGVSLLCGEAVRADGEMAEWVQAVVGSDSARFLKMEPGQTPQDMIYDTAALPKLRLLMPEDLAWSRLDLARRAGYEGEAGSIPSSQAGVLLNSAVTKVWERVRSRLIDLSRESVIERSLLNLVAARKEHRDWMRSTAAQLVLYDNAKVQAAANERVFRRDTAALACRVIAEMALCTSPCGTGLTCTATELDFLISEVSTLLECANQSDALHYGLASATPVMLPNGSFQFDAPAAEATSLLLSEHWRRTFRDAARDEVAGGKGEAEEGVADPKFPAAFVAEFGLSPEQYLAFVDQVTLEAVELKEAHFRLRRSEVVQRLREVGTMDPERVFGAFALAPRCKWDEEHPDNAKARDWYPWRYNRRLSILRRPLVQLSMEDDPVVFVVPSLLAGTFGYLHQAAFGDLPDTLFDSREMTALIGRTADRNGHEFARRVAERLGGLGWQTEREVSLTRLGGEASLGDIDVLTWQLVTGVVYAVECKSLRFDRTYGEIGERLAEYSAGTVGGKRTPLQKHLDRISYLEANRECLAELAGIPVDRLQLRSALITEKLGSMQFTGKAREMLDLVTDYELLEEALSNW